MYRLACVRDIAIKEALIPGTLWYKLLHDNMPMAWSDPLAEYGRGTDDRGR